MNLFIFLSELIIIDFLIDSYGLYYYYTQLDNPDLVEKIDKMLKKSRYIGIFCVEFLVDKMIIFIFWKSIIEIQVGVMP